jgi:hypothetical protein
MLANARMVSPELLDEMDPNDPRARRSRGDLRRVHFAMGSLSILGRAIEGLALVAPPSRLLELGAGDASLVLRLARAQPTWQGVSFTVLDRHDLISAETRRAYEQLGWHLTVRRVDVIEWARDDASQGFDLCLANLFLHHFDTPVLGSLLSAIAARSHAFVACEPRRSRLSRLGSRLIGLLGANSVTRHDAVVSVDAGFSDHELSAIWPPSPEDWRCKEYAAPPFTHCFTAVRPQARDA